MLLFSFLALLFPLSSAKISIHETRDTGDLDSMHFLERSVANSKDYMDLENWKTGEKMKKAYEMRYNFDRFANDTYQGFLWKLVQRVEDGLMGWEVFECADSDRLWKYGDGIEIGESKTFENGTVKVSCARFDGSVRRVSEAVSGCYFNETVYPFHEQWTEPNPKGNETRLKKLMRCEVSEEGYFVSRLIGCSFHYRRNVNEIGLNSTWYFHGSGSHKTCVETEPGVVQLLEGVENNYKAGCLVDNVFHKEWEMWYDDMKGARFQCSSHGDVYKQLCTPAKMQSFSPGNGAKLKNGCTFYCHPQTNIFKCDKPMEMFKVVGKPRKMRQRKDFMFARNHF